MLYVYKLPHGFMPFQLENFPAGCARSCEGALHLRPNSLAKMTKAEADCLKAERPDVARLMTLIKKVKPEKPQKNADLAKAKEAPKATAEELKVEQPKIDVAKADKRKSKK